MGVRGTPALSPALRAGAASPRRAPLTILGAGGVRVPRPAPATTRGASLLHCLRVRKAERTRTRSGMSPCVCLSVCPPPPTYVVSPQSLTDGKGRGDTQTCRSHHGGPLCRSRLLQQVPPPPINQSATELPPGGSGGLCVALALPAGGGGDPACGDRSPAAGPEFRGNRLWSSARPACGCGPRGPTGVRVAADGGAYWGCPRLPGETRRGALPVERSGGHLAVGLS